MTILQSRTTGMLDVLAGLVLTFGVLGLYFLYSWSFTVLTNQVLHVLELFSYLTIILLLVGIVVSISGFWRILKAERRAINQYVQPPLISVLAAILGERRYVAMMALVSTGYGLIFAVISSVIIYRPSENFLLEYSAAIPSVLPVVCCDRFGFTPVFSVYLTEHLGLLIIPANLLILIAVSSLVGLNVVLAAYAVAHRPKHANAQWLGGLGAIVGLFTGCPTCAGLFLANMIQQTGGMAMAASGLAAYQPLFIAITIPLLVAGAILSIQTLRMVMYESCRVVRRHTLLNDEDRVVRTIMFILGVLWIVDGVLQLQPASFTATFADDILAPNLLGQPAAITSIINFGVQFFNMNPFVANLAAAVLQLFIGFALVLPFKRTLKVFALYLSIAWALIVWVFGEGLGNIFTGNASFYTGAPGSVLLYLILTVFLLYPKKFTAKRLPIVAGAVFLFGALLQLLPTFWSASGVESVFSLAASDSIEAIAGPAGMISNLASEAPVIGNAVLVLLLVVFGGLSLFRPSRIVAVSVGVFLILIWWFGQDFGGILTYPASTATDPNSAIVLIPFLIPLLMRPKPTGASDSPSISRAGSKSTGKQVFAFLLANRVCSNNGAHTHKTESVTMRRYKSSHRASVPDPYSVRMPYDHNSRSTYEPISR